MLILTRKLNEVITIGDDIQVKVLSIKGGQVRLGIDAPKEVQVCRGNVGQSSEGVLTDSAMQQ